MDLLGRYKAAIERLANKNQMIKGKESGVDSPECKTRILYAKRVLENLNSIEAVEAGVISEMELQVSGSPVVTETLLGEHPVR